MPNIREKLIKLLISAPMDEFGRCGLDSLADHLIANGVTLKGDKDINVPTKWISVKDRLPHNFVSVLGYMTDAGEFPPVRECYTVGNAFFFPALGDVHPVSHWAEMPQPPKGEKA